MTTKYVEGRSVEFAKSFEESGPGTPMFFILSPGVDPLKDVEAHGRKVGWTSDNNNFHNISLGQGQEIVAEQAMDLAAKEGHWVVLQNVHLVAKWLSTLEKKMELYSQDSNENYRLFVSAEPAGTRDAHIIPQGILESSIKITNEPPTGMFANLHKAFDNFNQVSVAMSPLTLKVQGPSYLGLTRSISWLLMPWLLTSPGHQQPWYWLYRMCRSFPYLRKDFKYMCQINVEEWHEMQIYVYVPSEKFST